MTCPRCRSRNYVPNYGNLECISCGYNEEAERDRQATPLPRTHGDRDQRVYVRLLDGDQGRLFR